LHIKVSHRGSQTRTCEAMLVTSTCDIPLHIPYHLLGERNPAQKRVWPHMLLWVRPDWPSGAMRDSSVCSWLGKTDLHLPSVICFRAEVPHRTPGLHEAQPSPGGSTAATQPDCLHWRSKPAPVRTMLTSLFSISVRRNWAGQL
jgi:hypothetical protein